MDTTTESVTVGCFVSYTDVANPRRFGRVTAVDQHNPWSPYTVAWDDGDVSHTDLRQHGWRHEEVTAVIASRSDRKFPSWLEHPETWAETQEGVNAYFLAEGPPATYELLRSMAAVLTAAFPQYDGHFDRWCLGRAQSRCVTKGGLACEAGDVVLYKPAGYCNWGSAHPTILSLRTGGHHVGVWAVNRLWTPAAAAMDFTR